MNQTVVYYDCYGYDPEKYSKPMPWIGIYITVASLFCVLAMVADLIHGLKNRKLWFPCKTFTLNAASVTVIAVAMKLPMDLSNSMPSRVDQVAKIGSMAFMCTMMANLLPSLATMNDKELLTNIIALDILVITLIVNVCIQIYTGVIGDPDEFRIRDSTLCIVMAWFYVAMLLILLIIHTCSGLTILKSKQIIELKYQAGHETALKGLELQQPGRLTVEKLKQHVKNHLIMAETGSPQFITACSATTSASGVICVVSTVMHIYILIYMTLSTDPLGSENYPNELIKNRWWGFVRSDYPYPRSDYEWSIPLILIIQFIGSLVGTIAPLCRCYAAMTFKLSIDWIWNHIKVFKVESYWTQKLYDWKQSSTPFSGQNPEQQENFNDHRPYVLQLQNDMELSERTLKSISKSANRLIKKAEKQQPINLVKLLRESKGFEGVGKYDSLHVPPLFAEDFLDCWSLPLVTLTAIAVSLPEIQNDRIDRLLSSVSEGLTYVTLVEESLNVADKYVSTQKAAKVLWLEVEVSNKWVGNNLKNHAPEVNTAGLILHGSRIQLKTWSLKRQMIIPSTGLFAQIQCIESPNQSFFPTTPTLMSLAKRTYSWNYHQ
ncbi:hypothetical protein CTI12_AA331520 [Artemisia annua]|uniref:Uncharacterized protein n=1 Tax=Artemisia annua TaxID=35608 RepID=A0A2U1MXF9_ARTAN|nr:hypothetical protein CTI12_AA331520 [Artemisia annua]